MNKKSQISAFIIIGIVILIAGGILIYVKNSSVKSKEIEPTAIIEVPVEKNAIAAYIQDCIIKESTGLIEELGRQGGTLNRSIYSFTTYPGIGYIESAPYIDAVTHLNSTDLQPYYFKINYTYFCEYNEFKGCVNSLIVRKRMQDELNSKIKEGLNDCIHLEQFRNKGYTVIEGSKNVQTTIASEEVQIQLNYPIKISKNDFVIEIKEYQASIKSDLGELYDLAVNITNNEISQGYFDEDEWMRNAGGEVQIEKHKPYPDTVYSLKKYNTKTKKEYAFNFAIQGKDTVSLIGFPSQVEVPNPYCNMPDGNCYANSDISLCTSLGGVSSTVPKCESPSSYLNGCTNCRSCGNHTNGESWCVYDSIVGNGYDYVGSRHYKQTCIDGRIYDTECRDFREELCTEDNSSTPKKAVCRVNRWQDCAEQKNKVACEDASKRDCKWDDWLVNASHPSYAMQRTDRGCHPDVPPGFRFWIGQSEQVCNVANEWRRCDGFACPLVWEEKVIQYCYFQGDCGRYRNIADKIGGDLPTLETPRNYIYLKDGWPERADSSDNRLELPLDKRNQGLLNGQEFDNPQGNYLAMLDGAIAFVEEASKWDICDFCDCAFGIPTGNCEFDKTVFIPQICRPWEAPLTGSDCEKCSEDSSKPCTEYRCKSLGTKCSYLVNSTTGVGSCTDKIGEDTTGPRILGYENIAGNYTMQPDYLLDMEGVRICNGNSCNDDDSGEDGIQPYSKLKLTLNLSEPAQCKLSPLPALNYGQIPSFGASPPFSTTYTTEITVVSLHDIESLILQLSGFTNLFSFIDLDLIQNKIETLASGAKELADKLGQDTSQIDWALNMFRTDIMPKAKQLKEGAGELLNEMMVQLTMKNIVSFVRCRDQSGNENSAEFFIKYTVAKDKEPPQLMNITPPNASLVTDPFDLKISLNEPSICKFSLGADDAYSSMPYTMDCALSWFDFNNGLYECKYTIPVSGASQSIYIKCADQPPATNQYVLHLVESTNFSVAHEEYSNMVFLQSTYIINITNDRILKNNNTQINVNIDTVQLTLLLDKESVCKYDSSPFKFEAMTNDLPCVASGDKYLCSKNLAGIPGNHTYYIGCRDVAVQTPNINQQSYVLQYFKG